MIDSRKPLFGNWNYLLVVIAIPIVTLICAAFDMHSDGDFNVARREVLLRRIGHELLLQSGDSTSRVLPIKKIVENEYQISFEHKLMFRTDSLIALTRRLLGRDQLTGNYIVNVHHAGNSSVAYSYAISKNEDETIVACQGRTQPTAYYT
ncbi:MAG: transcriptional regulator, partial [Pedobacter sp.]